VTLVFDSDNEITNMVPAFGAVQSTLSWWLLVHIGCPRAVLVVIAASEAENKPLRYHVQEETAAGALVGNILNDSGLRRRYNTDVLRLLRFRFVADAGVPLFDIGATTGELRTTATIDRESPGLCAASSGGGRVPVLTSAGDDDYCELRLSVVVQPVEYLRIIRVIVVVDDVNDHAPRFRETTVRLPINEAAAPGSSYILPTASDADGRRFGSLRYELATAAAAAGKFTLSTTHKVDGSTHVRLVLAGRLDREVEPQYRLRLLAYDGGQPARSGSVDIVVSVADSNDNRPRFTSDEYEATVAENAPVGTVVVQVLTDAHCTAV